MANRSPDKPRWREIGTRTPQEGDAAWSSAERLGLAAVCALAVGLRWHQIGQLSLVHFDEGVLVSGAFGVWLNGLWHFPLAQPLQAPPLFPWMVAATFGITGTPWPIMGIYLSAALGAATVVIYFALLRRLYGGKLALVAAALLAASDLHVAFSRMALTDAALTFWFVTGAYFLVRLVQADSGERARHVFWGLALGLATGAAWNTKYNGWMLVAMAATTAMIVAARDDLLMKTRWMAAEPIAACPGRGLPGHRLGSAPATERFSRLGVVLSIALGAAVAVACFAPWYLYVERTYPGGYRAVTENHLRYVGHIDEWLARAARLGLSLSAFRHFGWLTSLIAAPLALGLAIAQGRRASQSSQTTGRPAMLFLIVVALAGWAAAVALGADALIIVLATAAIVPALVWGRWPEVFFAVWTGAFMVLTPFYHPYARLLVPVLPAAIALAMWLVAGALSAGDSKETIRERLAITAKPAAARTARLLLAPACLGALVAAVAWHPFGWFPNREVWNRWSTRQSYRALGDAVLQADLPSDAMVLCQGPPAMTLYIERPWTPLETVPFDLWLTRVEQGRECYLAVDFWGAYGENHQLALRAIRERLNCLEPVAVVANDLNLPTLLDYLPAAAVAERLSRRWPLKRVEDAGGRAVVMPADFDEPFASIIVLYRIDRRCLPGILDKTPPSALK